jgi:hypothetical protein
MKIIHHIESSEYLLRFTLKAMVILLFLALIVLLVTAWLVSDPLLKMLDSFSHKTLQKTGRQNFKGLFLPVVFYK